MGFSLLLPCGSFFIKCIVHIAELKQLFQSVQMEDV